MLSLFRNAQNPHYDESFVRIVLVDTRKWHNLKNERRKEREQVRMGVRNGDYATRRSSQSSSLCVG